MDLLIIFGVLAVGVAGLTPLLLRRAARDESDLDEGEEFRALEEPAHPLGQPWRWLIRITIALFFGFVLTGLINELAGRLALLFGQSEVELERAGREVALWPRPVWGKVLEWLVFSLPVLVLTSWLDERFLIPITRRQTPDAPSPRVPQAGPNHQSPVGAPEPPGPSRAARNNRGRSGKKGSRRGR